MGRFLVGIVCGAALLAAGALVYTRGSDGCFGRCGAGTECRDHTCLAEAAPAPGRPIVTRHHRHHGGGDSPAAPPPPQLHPGDEKMVAEGDGLGRPEHIDLTAQGDDGRELQQEDLDGVFNPAQPAIERCITDALGDLPLETGKVIVGLRVERAGRVSRVRVEAPAVLQRHGLTRCIRGVVDPLHFPASGGASVVTYPFELK